MPNIPPPLEETNAVTPHFLLDNPSPFSGDGVHPAGSPLSGRKKSPVFPDEFAGNDKCMPTNPNSQRTSC